MDKQLNCGAFKSKVLSVSISLVAWAAYPQCSTTLNVDCVLEWYYYASDALSSQTSLPVSSLVLPEVTLGTELFDAWHTRCITMNFIGMDFHFSSNDIGASFNVQSAQKLDLELGLDFFKNTLLNGQEAHLTPTFTHCGDVPWITDHLGGTNNLYVFHAGTGPYPKKKAHAKYHTCRDIIVENGSTEPIEIPITIQGSVWASVQTFANNTYARSKLRVWGSVGGQPFDQSAAVEATSIFPESQDINVTSRYVVSPGQGRNAVHLEINAESLTETQAKGGGLWGMLSSAATGGADFPSGITVGNFTGTGGKPLPTGIRVYDAADMKTVYANTAPVLEVLPPSVSESRLRIFAPTNCACTILVSTNMTNWSQLLSTNLGPGACILSETKSNAVTTKFYRLSMP